MAEPHWAAWRGRLAVVDPVVVAALEAMQAGDWDELTPLLHPHLHWTRSDGAVVRGRTRMLALLRATPPTTLPLRYELRDRQIYRWVEPRS